MTSEARARLFVVAPSGSGKTFACQKYPNLFFDMDVLFNEKSVFPKIPNWYLNHQLKLETDCKARDVLLGWLNGEKDGKIGLYADDLGFMPFAYVIRPLIEYHDFMVLRTEEQKRTLKHHPDISEWDRLCAHRVEIANRVTDLRLKSMVVQNFTTIVQYLELIKSHKEIIPVKRVRITTGFDFEKQERVINLIKSDCEVITNREVEFGRFAIESGSLKAHMEDTLARNRSVHVLALEGAMFLNLEKGLSSEEKLKRLHGRQWMFIV